MVSVRSDLSAGVLGEFVRQARGRKIAQGSVLIVENPDRISRQKFATAYARFYQPVLEAGGRGLAEGSRQLIPLVFGCRNTL